MKKLVSILILALVFTSVPVFAGYDISPSGAENLKHYGFIQGGTGGDLMTGMTLDRQQMAILVCELNGKKNEAKAYGAPSGFVDEAGFPDWSRSFISYARLNRWMNGLPDGRFDNLGAVSGQQLATAMLNVLGRPHAWGEGISILRGLGVDIPDLPTLTRGQAFDAMWKVVSTPIMSDGRILGEMTGRLVPKTLELKSVSTPDLTRAVFRFSEPIQNTDAVLTNFKVEGAEALTVAYDDGGREITLSFSKPLTINKEYTASVGTTRLAEDPRITLGPQTVKFRAVDESMPKVQKVEFTGPKSVRILFDETIQKGGKIEIKSGSTVIAVNAASLKGYGSAAVTADLFTSLKEGTSYDVTVSEFEDLAGYRCENRTHSVVYQKTSGAVSVSVLEATQSYVSLRFSRAVKGLSPDNFWHTFGSYKALKLTRSKEASDPEIKPGDTVESAVVWFYLAGSPGNNPLPVGSVKVGMLAKATTTVTDAWGEALADMEMTASVSDSSSKPKVAELRMTAPDRMLIKFDMKVTKPEVAVTKKDGSALTGYVTDIPKAGPDTEYEVVFNKAVEESAIRVSVKNAAELSVNQRKMDDYVTELAVSDLVAPQLLKVGYSQVGTEHFLHFIFNEPMGASALNAANYQMEDGGAYTSLSEAGVFEPNGATVKIKLTEAQEAKFNLGTTKGFVTNVKDEAGNLVKPGMVLVQALAAATDVTADEVAFVSPTEAHVLFNQLLIDVQPDAFTFNGDTMMILGQEEAGGKTLLRLQPKNPLTVAEQDLNNLIQIAVGSVTGEHGGKNTMGNLMAADKVSPRIAKIEFNAVTNQFTAEFEGALSGVEDTFAFDWVILGEGVKLTPVTHYVTVYNAPTTTVTITLLGVRVDQLGRGASNLSDYSLSLTPSIQYMKDASGNPVEKYPTQNFKR